LLSKIDPYTVIVLNKQKLKTKSIKKTQNPEWNESFTLDVSNFKTDNIEFSIYDKDLLSKDDLVGVTTLSLVDAVKGVSQDILLPIEAKAKKKNTKESHLYIRYTPEFGKILRPRLKVHVDSASNVGGSSVFDDIDPYVVLKLNDNKKTTSAISHTRNPDIHEDYEFKVANPHDVLLIEVRDKNLLDHDQLISTASISLSNLIYDESTELEAELKLNKENIVLKKHPNTDTTRSYIKLKLHAIDFGLRVPHSHVDKEAELQAYGPVVDEEETQEEEHRVLKEVRKLDQLKNKKTNRIVEQGPKVQETYNRAPESEKQHLSIDSKMTIRRIYYNDTGDVLWETIQDQEGNKITRTYNHEEQEQENNDEPYIPAEFDDFSDEEGAQYDDDGHQVHVIKTKRSDGNKNTYQNQEDKEEEGEDEEEDDDEVIVTTKTVRKVLDGDGNVLSEEEKKDDQNFQKNNNIVDIGKASTNNSGQKMVTITTRGPDGRVVKHTIPAQFDNDGQIIIPREIRDGTAHNAASISPSGNSEPSSTTVSLSGNEI